jgi:hypothetical protein
MLTNEPGLKILLGGGFFFLRWVGNKQGRSMEIGSDCSRAEEQNLQLGTPRLKEETSSEDTEATIIDAASVCCRIKSHRRGLNMRLLLQAL